MPGVWVGRAVPPVDEDVGVGVVFVGRTPVDEDVGVGVVSVGMAPC
jgi:hypothetical protein